MPRSRATGAWGDTPPGALGCASELPARAARFAGSVEMRSPVDSAAELGAEPQFDEPAR